MALSHDGALRGAADCPECPVAGWVKAWALDWSTQIGLAMAESQPWSDEEEDQGAAWDE